MEAVKAFNAELSSLYEVKPPISKAKMTSLTRGAIKAIKFYKHVVQSVEKFILKCKPEYKVPGLYVIDSIVRQSRHQFGSDKDVFAPRFSKNMQQTFINLFKCPAEDKSKIIRVLNLWQKNQVFPPEVIQPLFDLADPNNPIYKELGTPVQQPTNGLNTSTAASVIAKGSPALQRTPTKGNQPGNESVHGATSNLNLTDPNVLQQLQQLQRLLTKNVDNSARADSQVHFDKKLLDFDYGDEEDEVNPSPRPQPTANDSVSSLLTNPEVLRQLQTLQQTMAGAPPEMDVDKMRKLQEMKQQEDEFDKHLAQTVPNLPFASECEFKPNNNQMMGGYFMPTDMNPPNPNFPVHEYEPPQQLNKNAGQDNGPDVEVITLDHDDSRSGTPSDERYRRRRGSRSRSRDRSGRRDRDKDKDRRRRSRSRSRSPGRRHRSRSRDRERNRIKEKKEEKETEKDRERKKRGLPAIKKDHLSVCSTTLWVGHLSKLVHQDDLSNTFGEFGDVVSIDLIPPRGCAFIVMLRRQDAARCLGKLKGHVLHGKAITLAWAPGKGVKGKDLKDYWEGDLGVSYIPYTKIKEDIDIEMLEDGGMIDEDTMPDWMREKVEKMGKKPSMSLSMPNDLPPSFMMNTEPQNNSATIDTSQPPPMPGAGLLQPPPLLPLVSPFQFNNRLLGMNVPPGMMPNMPNLPNMPNIPIGVPPPNIPGPMMTSQLLGIGSPFQGPPGMMPPQMPNLDNKPTPPSTEANLQSLSESLMNITQSFGMVPQPPAPHDDTMDIEMEDAEKTMDKSLALSEQLQQLAGQFGRANRDDDRRDRRDDRDRRRSRSRERDRDRDRDRERDRERDRDRDRVRGQGSRDRDRRDRDNSRGRDRDRRDDRRDRGNRWGDRDRDRERDRRDVREPESREDKREREKNLNDRLREMAGMGGLEDPNRDRPPKRDRKNSENGPRTAPVGPPAIKPEDEFMKGPPNRGPPRGGDFGPPRGPMDEFPPPMMEGQPPLLRGPPDLMREGPSDMMDGPPMMMDGPPNIMMDAPPDMMNGPGRPGPGPMHRGPPNMLEGPPLDMMLEGPPDMMREGPPDMMRDGPPNMMRDGPPNMMRDGPPNMMRDGPPMMRDGPPNMMRDGPPDMMRDGPPDMMDGPPDMLRDGPPPGMMRDGPPHMRDGPPPNMMDGPPMMMDGPPDMPPQRMHPRGGRRDFEPRGMRGPPPPGPDFFPRDDFGPRGPPMMRGGPDFGPRGPPMMGPRGPRGQFFGPRGPRQRGPYRHDGPPNFNPRFDGPPPNFFRGQGPRGPPPMFDDGPHARYRGPPPRFEDRRRGRPGPDFSPEFMDRGPGGPPDFMDRGPGGPPDFMDRGPGGPPDFMDRGPGGPQEFMDRDPGGLPEFMDRGPGGPPPDFMERGMGGPPHNRQERRSRWGGSPQRHNERNNEEGMSLEEQQNEQVVEYENVGDMGGEGSSTPVRDECPPPESEQMEPDLASQGDATEAGPPVDEQPVTE